jgi:hypothetical protein
MQLPFMLVSSGLVNAGGPPSPYAVNTMGELSVPESRIFSGPENCEPLLNRTVSPGARTTLPIIVWDFHAVSADRPSLLSLPPFEST